MDFVNQVICGDSREILKQIPDESVDLVLTDPPYGIGKEDIANDEDLSMFEAVYNIIKTKLKKDAWFVCWTAIKRLPDMFKIIDLDFKWQYIVYMPNREQGRATIGFRAYDSVLIFNKGKPKQNKSLRDVYELTMSTNKHAEILSRENLHVTPKPIMVVRKLIEAFSKPKDLVLDPFCGTGVTALACRDLDRRYTCIELEEKYSTATKEILTQTEIWQNHTS